MNRPTQHLWSEAEDERLIERFHDNVETIEEIGSGMGRSGASVRARLTKLRARGKVQKKRQGTRKKDREPTTVVDLVFAIDMLIDTRIRRFELTFTSHRPRCNSEEQMAELFNEAEVRCDNAQKRLEDVLGRWKP